MVSSVRRRKGGRVRQKSKHLNFTSPHNVNTLWWEAISSAFARLLVLLRIGGGEGGDSDEKDEDCITHEFGNVFLCILDYNDHHCAVYTCCETDQRTKSLVE